MKLELVKETSLTGVVHYSIEADGHYVPGTLSKDIEEVRTTFDSMVERKAVSLKETIKSETI